MKSLIFFTPFFVILQIHTKDINVALLKSKIDEYSKSDSWALQTIQRDFSSWNTEDLSPKNIKNLATTKYFKNDCFASVIVIKDNIPKILPINRKKLELREKNLLQALTILCENVFLQNTIALVSLHDSLDENDPVLCFAKEKTKQSIMIPDFEALGGYKELTQKIELASNKNPWHSKLDMIFWRGSLTGGTYTLDNFYTIPRSQLVNYSHQYPEYLDAKFIKQGQANQEVLNHMGKLDYFTIQSPQEKALKYKFLIDIDGNSCCYSRTYWTLLSNSLVFKIKSNNIQWYYELLKDQEHYIEIKEDLSNLKDAFCYYLLNQQQAQIIASKSTELVKAHLSREAILAYLYLVLNKISTLQSFKKIKE